MGFWSEEMQLAGRENDFGSVWRRTRQSLCCFANDWKGSSSTVIQDPSLKRWMVGRKKNGAWKGLGERSSRPGGHFDA
ncbi:MAG: hypothetical protein CSA75_02525 [Sorangium cellulosum]|nr:MAG: hypothetical protein CSA75_02525 [Sorangium cellulosum]